MYFVKSYLKVVSSNSLHSNTKSFQIIALFKFCELVTDGKLFKSMCLQLHYNLFYDLIFEQQNEKGLKLFELTCFQNLILF